MLQDSWRTKIQLLMKLLFSWMNSLINPVTRRTLASTQGWRWEGEPGSLFWQVQILLTRSDCAIKARGRHNAASSAAETSSQRPPSKELVKYCNRASGQAGDLLWRFLRTGWTNTGKYIWACLMEEFGLGDLPMCLHALCVPVTACRVLLLCTMCRSNCIPAKESSHPLQLDSATSAEAGLVQFFKDSKQIKSLEMSMSFSTLHLRVQSKMQNLLGLSSCISHFGKRVTSYFSVHCRTRSVL